MRWKKIEEDSSGGGTYRTPVPGGWLIQVILSGVDEVATGITFYPDPNHEWDGKSLF